VTSKEDQTSLIWLQWHYESHFKISLEDGGIWQALPLYADDVLTADDPMKLRDAMKNHFSAQKRVTST